MLTLKAPLKENRILRVHFEEYLQPRKPNKSTQLQQFEQLAKADRVPTPKPTELTSEKGQEEPKESPAKAFVEIPRSQRSTQLPNKWQQLVGRWQQQQQKQQSADDSATPGWRRLPSWLAFLRARNDDGLCKRKTGFEIYCEMASFHGFANFVGATTWQRALWFLIICVAIVMSLIVLVMSHLLAEDTPTVIYTESTTYASAAIPFPALSICSVNRISRRRAAAFAKQLTVNASAGDQTALLQRLTHAVAALEGVAVWVTVREALTELDELLAARNYTLDQLLQSVEPRCLDDAQLLRCKWRGVLHDCQRLFRAVESSEGNCCTFNYVGNADVDAPLRYASGGGEGSGLTLLLHVDRADYAGGLYASADYQLLLHAADDWPTGGSAQSLWLAANTVNSVSVEARQTHASAYLRDERRRRCRYADERALHTFGRYTQANCLAECWSAHMWQQCACVPPKWPRWRPDWPPCTLAQLACITAGRENFTRQLRMSLEAAPHAQGRQRASDVFLCDCLPSCEFNQYAAQLETTPLVWMSYSVSNDLFAGIELHSHIVLHVHYEGLLAERLRVDVYENWLSFVGTFGGITGLFMGYSVVSAFEMVFFVFVRPACNWLTKRQIRYRIRRRQRQKAKAAALAAAAQP